jgi:predicted AlkP superfamily pyrophosphatase or phosphodiesterase
LKILIFLTIFFSLNLTATEGQKYKHVVLIGIDGLGTHNLYRSEFNGVAPPAVPHLNNIKENAAWTGKAQIDLRNWSGPNWVGMITGSNSDEHGVHTNGCRRSKEIPSIYQMIKEQMSDTQISVLYDWDKIKCHAGKGFVDYFKKIKGTPGIAENAILELKNKKPTFMFVYFGKVDTEGHSKGGFSKEYKKALEEVDMGVGKIIDYLKTSGLDKETLVIVTADHGHEPTSGNHSSVDFPVPFFLMGPGIVPGEITDGVRNNQVAAIVAFALGINPSPKWSSTIENLDVYFSGN